MPRHGYASLDAFRILPSLGSLNLRDQEECPSAVPTLLVHVRLVIIDGFRQIICWCPSRLYACLATAPVWVKKWIHACLAIGDHSNMSGPSKKDCKCWMCQHVPAPSHLPWSHGPLATLHELPWSTNLPLFLASIREDRRIYELSIISKLIQAAFVSSVRFSSTQPQLPRHHGQLIKASHRKLKLQKSQVVGAR